MTLAGCLKYIITSPALTKGFLREQQIWKLWFKLCDYLNVVRFSDLIWNLIYWYSRTVLNLSIIVWHFHNFEALSPFISKCLLEIKSCISLCITLTILNVLGWNRTEIWRSEGIFTFFVRKIFEIWRPEELFAFVLTFLFWRSTKRRR